MEDLAIQGIALRNLRKSMGIRLSMIKSIGTMKYQHDVEYNRAEVRKALKVRLNASGAI